MIEHMGLPKSLDVYSRFLDHVFEICLRINAVCNKNIFTLHVYFVKELKNKKMIKSSLLWKKNFVNVVASNRQDERLDIFI